MTSILLVLVTGFVAWGAAAGSMVISYRILRIQRLFAHDFLRISAWSIAGAVFVLGAVMYVSTGSVLGGVKGSVLLYVSGCTFLSGVFVLLGVALSVDRRIRRK